MAVLTEETYGDSAVKRLWIRGSSLEMQGFLSYIKHMGSFLLNCEQLVSRLFRFEEKLYVTLI